ncbi:glycyl-radical enzyme activating protein [Enterococcus sp. DIV0187]|uniref:glycyl-radical enzyme activating protein n=1 Tax=Enterococcus sp. DIV0187 TaxID=2774644 RepID=UPI003F23A730
MIFNIQRCSVHDGSGLRTLVFLKGCPLRCLWCANPESQSYVYDIMEFPARCISCGACERVCPEKAISVVDGEYRIDRKKCKRCFKCADACFAEAKRIVGQENSVEELFNEIKKDQPFYSLYGGGVTFSGGEPLTQPKFLSEIAKKCQENGINVAIESCGYGKYEDFKCVLPYVDYMFLDIKHIDSKQHKNLTGIGNRVILENVRQIAEYGIPITVRTPIIPGYNDSPENIIGISKFLCTLPAVKEYELLAYHNLGESKYRSLGIPYELKEVNPPSDTEMGSLTRKANQVLNEFGKECFFTKDNEKEIVK